MIESHTALSQQDLRADPAEILGFFFFISKLPANRTCRLARCFPQPAVVTQSWLWGRATSWHSHVSWSIASCCFQLRERIPSQKQLKH